MDNYGVLGHICLIRRRRKYYYSITEDTQEVSFAVIVQTWWAIPALRTRYSSLSAYGYAQAGRTAGIPGQFTSLTLNSF